MEWVEKRIGVTNRFGLHARAAARLVAVASAFASEIRMVRDGIEVDCKSILDILSTACTQGTSVTVKACGHDAREALQAVEALFVQKFGEE